MVPFPCSPDMTRLYDHTIYEHTLRSTRCSITIYRSLQQEEWNTNQIARNLWKNSLSVNSASSPVRSERTMRRIRRAHHVSILGLLQREVPACKGGGIYSERTALVGLLFHQLTKLYPRSFWGVFSCHEGAIQLDDQPSSTGAFPLIHKCGTATKTRSRRAPLSESGVQ